MTRRLIATLLTLGLGLLPGLPAAACDTGEALAGRDPAHTAHARAEAQAPDPGHDHHRESDAPPAGDAAGCHPSAPARDAQPVCCMGSCFAATALPGQLEDRSARGSVDRAAVAEARTVWAAAPSGLDLRRLRLDELRSPYVRTRSPLLI